ncbi:TPA: CRTAC1 family protein, partial [Candidatus Poribacteria bacterium]|nr:CRTAC1 family protein [Candidatus Poribacteria bacterium]
MKGLLILSLFLVVHGVCLAVEVRFTNVTQSAGVDFVHVDGRSGEKYFMETLGSGVAFFDYDNDGDADLYFVNSAPLPGYMEDHVPTNHLYRNNGDGTFTVVTEEAGVGDIGYGHGCATGDYDSDGDLDLYVTNYGRNVFYRNNGNGTFTDVAEEAGVASELWGTSCAFADYDNDGDLDLYVVNYIEFDIAVNPWCGLKESNIRAYCEPNSFSGQPDILYQNNGDGTFTDVTRTAGIFNPSGKGLGVTWGDYDNDSDLDIYIANDSTENFFYQNNGDGKFEEIGFMIGLAVSEDGNAENGMGTAFGDLNNDGWLDLIVTNYADQTNTLYRNDGDGFFTDITRMSRTGKISFPYLGWATFFFDYDNDGLQDLYVANGHLHENLSELGQEGTYPQPDLIFKNNGDGSFTEIADQLGDVYRPTVSRGAAWADYDLDGDVDMIATNSNGRPKLLRNDGGNANQWISFNVDGIAIGTRITVQTGDILQTKEIGNQSGYLSQSEKRLHFGLGSTKQVDLIT